MQTVNDISFKQTRALVRVDFNVPLDDNLIISDTTRIDAALPTLKKILKDGGSLVIMSHLGRPKLEYQSVKLGAEEKFSLAHVADYLEDALNTEVIFLDDCISEEAFKQTKALKKGEVVLLENLRYYPEEKAGEIDFAQMLALHGQVYVNDAFGTAHRAHASTAIIADSFTHENKCFGLLMAAEIENANRVLQSKEKPVTAILGGAKVSDKIKIIENLLPVADHIIIGGGMAYTFFKAQGFEIGNSLVEEDRIELAKELIEKAKESNTQLLLPKDSVVADAFSDEANTAVANNEKIDEGWMGLDIGPDARDAFSETILSSKIILWNGPMGVFEMSKFQGGTKAIADAVADATQAGAFSLVGGGDSVAAVNKFAYNDKVSYVSTGGGAMLEYFEGKTLPGIAAILKED
ncbi:MAG: phosphoglycerate kinase [Chitinophagales bacterium]|nr:phosphoglycerate kinase [Chitinophagales bacterium]